MRIHNLIPIYHRRLDQVEDWARWAHTDGYTPQGRRTTGTRPAPLPDPARPEPTADQAHGATYDTGLGDHTSREAFRGTWPHLRAADGFLAVACYLAGHHHQPSVAPRTLDRLELVDVTVRCAAIRSRLTLLEVDAGHDIRTATALRQSHHALGLAWDLLSAALHRGPADPSTQAVGEKRCIICGIRPRAATKGKRCEVCARWFTRNGTERPPSLDRADLSTPAAAQARRRSRGEGWGDESFSGARGA